MTLPGRQPTSRHIAVINRLERARTFVGAREIALAVEACRTQLEQHLPQLWPSLPRWTMALYESIDGIDIANVWPIYLIDDDGDDSTAAIHAALGDQIWGTVDVLGHPGWTVALSHEVVEIAVNPYVDQWVLMPDGREVIRESADPVQNTSYNVRASISGVSADVAVSNFVGETFFLPEGTGRLDWMHTLSSSLALGAGYWVVRRPGERPYLEFGARTFTMRAHAFQRTARTFRAMAGRAGAGSAV